MANGDVSIRDVDALRSNPAWKWLTKEWHEILIELQGTLVAEDYPNIYRTQGRVSSLIYVLSSLANLTEALEEIKNGTE